jgi:hypothetical protein
MTMRFRTNYAASTTSTVAADVLYGFFSFMTAAPPGGPGWVSVGESDGAAGGMGTTGLILSGASLASANAWFVLQSPDGSRQILFHRDVGAAASAGEAHYLYNRAADYVGGSSVALPTSASSREVYTATGFFTTGFFQYIADDAAPYGWIFFGYSGITARGCAAFFPVAEIQTGDPDPYVCIASSGAFAWTTINTTITAAGPKCWSADGTTWGGVAGLSYSIGSTPNIPNAGPLSVGGGVLLVPILLSTLPASVPAFVKGFMGFGMFKSAVSAPAKSVPENRQYIIFDTIGIPWDGLTDPL